MIATKGQQKIFGEKQNASSCFYLRYQNEITKMKYSSYYYPLVPLNLPLQTQSHLNGFENPDYDLEGVRVH